MKDILVSVVVVSYNSANYIIQTLNSIKDQTYKNIELVIADDSSKDNSIKLVEQWAGSNKKYFCDVKIIESLNNTGVTQNCNRGFKITSGEYIKLIAADDILENECIEKNVNFIEKQRCDILFSKINYFGDDYYENKNNNFVVLSNNFSDSNKKMLSKLLEINFISTPTSFIRKKTWIKLGGFDEKYKMMEDLPLWYKALKSNTKIGFMDEYTVKYRIHSDSITNQNATVIHKLFFDSKYSFYKDYLRKEIIIRCKFLTLIDRETEFLFYRRIIKKGNTKDKINNFDKMIFNLSPKRMSQLIKKRLRLN